MHLKQLTITYLLPKHLVRFLEFELGENYQFRRKNTTINKFLIDSFSPKNEYDIKKKRPENENYEEYSVVISQYIINQFNLYTINVQNEKLFIAWLEEYFNTLLNTYILSRMDLLNDIEQKYPEIVKHEYKMVAAIRGFCNRYNITEYDIAEDTLYKRIQRYQKEKL